MCIIEYALISLRICLDVKVPNLTHHVHQVKSPQRGFV